MMYVTHEATLLVEISATKETHTATDCYDAGVDDLFRPDAQLFYSGDTTAFLVADDIRNLVAAEK